MVAVRPQVVLKYPGQVMLMLAVLAAVSAGGFSGFDDNLAGMPILHRQGDEESSDGDRPARILRERLCVRDRLAGRILQRALMWVAVAPSLCFRTGNKGFPANGGSG
jgi:hypothetical protein